MASFPSTPNGKPEVASESVFRTPNSDDGGSGMDMKELRDELRIFDGDSAHQRAQNTLPTPNDSPADEKLSVKETSMQFECRPMNDHLPNIPKSKGQSTKSNLLAQSADLGDSPSTLVEGDSFDKSVDERSAQSALSNTYFPRHADAPYAHAPTTNYQVSQYRLPGLPPQPQQFPSSQNVGVQASPVRVGLSKKLTELVKKEPPIPTPVSAVYYPAASWQSLEKALSNPLRTRNVYIRGLRPSVDDDALAKIVSRFGRVESLKSIMDLDNGVCKGFGFVQYKSLQECEDCIRSLIFLNYQCAFAKESLVDRLRSLHDEYSANLYLSNLPDELTETDVEQLFNSQAVVSVKILRDSHGKSRNVGFARMINREVAQDVMDHFQDYDLPYGGCKLQIRFADTRHQKRLKNQTAQRRSWRAREYELLTSRTSRNSSLSESQSSSQLASTLHTSTTEATSNGANFGVNMFPDNLTAEQSFNSSIIEPQFAYYYGLPYPTGAPSAYGPNNLGFTDPNRTVSDGPPAIYRQPSITHATNAGQY